MWNGRSGIRTLATTPSTIFWNSWKIFRRVSALVAAMPMPMMKAVISAVITPISGGISTVKRPESIVSSAFCALSITMEPTFRKVGKIVLSTKKAKVPAMSVDR